MIVRVFVYVGQGVVCIQEVLFRYLKPYEKTSKACEWSQIYCVYKHLPLSVSTSGAGGPALLNRHGTNLSLRNNCFSRFSLFVQVKETRTSWPLPPTQTPNTVHVTLHRLRQTHSEPDPEKHERFSCAARLCCTDESATLDVTRYFDVQWTLFWREVERDYKLTCW